MRHVVAMMALLRAACNLFQNLFTLRPLHIRLLQPGRSGTGHEACAASRPAHTPSRDSCSNIKIRLAHLRKAYPPPQRHPCYHKASIIPSPRCGLFLAARIYEQNDWLMALCSRHPFPLSFVARSCCNRRTPITQSMA